MAIPKQKLEFWAENKYNVLFVGRHGVGKTSIVRDLFNERYGTMGEDWLYFSASTMDPWVDFVGVPREVTGKDGISYLTLIRPEVFAKDQIKAIFVDEFNRAPKKVRNAIMELTQFGSINGHKFEKLEIIWGAINPPNDDDELQYDVDEIDPAQLDRFHVQVDIPYTPSKVFFKQKYGADAGVAAVEWWLNLPTQVKDLVSPRRLDYVLDCFSKNGDIKDLLPKEANSQQLLIQLNEGSFKKVLEDMYSSNDTETATTKLKDENFFSGVVNIILKKNDYTNFFIPLIPNEKFSTLMSKKKERAQIITNCEANQNLKSLMEETVMAGTANKSVINDMKGWINKHFPDSPISELSLNDILEEPHSQTFVNENTHYRRKRMENLYSYLKYAESNNIGISDKHCKKICRFFAIAVTRSHDSTITQLEEMGLRESIMIIENNFGPISKWTKKGIGNSFGEGLDYINEVVKKGG